MPSRPPVLVTQSSLLTPDYRATQQQSSSVGTVLVQDPVDSRLYSPLRHSASRSGSAIGGGGGNSQHSTGSQRRSSSGQLQDMHRQVRDARVKVEQAKQTLSGSNRLVPVFMKDTEGN